jgi:hypothetical protein
MDLDRTLLAGLEVVGRPSREGSPAAVTGPDAPW